MMQRSRARWRRRRRCANRCSFNFGVVGATDTEFGIREHAGNTKGAQLRTDAADEITFFCGVADDDSGDEDVFAGADEGASGNVDQSGDGGERRGF
jgi:hypothetical protein